jgi:RNA polymerase primary sigma factor
MTPTYQKNIRLSLRGQSMKLPKLKSSRRYGSLPARNLLIRHGRRADLTGASLNESGRGGSPKPTGAVPVELSLASPNTSTKPEAVQLWSRPDALTQYLREASEVALLTREEETAVARRVKNGDEPAREQMICANLRLVVKIAREYENLGLPLLDLISEGNLGLMKAVERFDPDKGAKFSTYSSFWIKERIRRALANQSRTIRLPVHVADRIYQLTQAEVRLRGELGRDATDEELAEHFGTRVQSIAKLRRATQRPTSLDAPLADENSNTVAEMVADESAGLPSDQLLNKTETKLVCQLIGKLPEREACIIRLRFGLHSGTERTLEDLGREFRLTRERIRQLQNIALRKLRQMLEQPDITAASF